MFVRELVVLRGQARPVCGILEGQEKGKLRLGRLWSNGQEVRSLKVIRSVMGPCWQVLNKEVVGNESPFLKKILLSP